MTSQDYPFVVVTIQHSAEKHLLRTSSSHAFLRNEGYLFPKLVIQFVVTILLKGDQTT